ncbi:MAG: penicillin-binding protein 2 [Thermoanaerobaculales bacterium]
MEFREDIGSLRRRAAVLVIVFLGALGLLHLRLIDLQIVHGRQWQRLAENNRLRRLPLPGARGWIYDRRGRVLADNIPTWELLLFPDEARDLGTTGLFLGRLDIVEVRTFHERLAERRIGRMAPMVVGEDLSWNQVAAIRAHQSDHPELSVVGRFRRRYPYGPQTAHVVGHLRPISKDEADAFPRLEPDALVGANGIEAAENPFLAAETGERWVMVSAVGRQLGVVREIPATAGRDLGLTLDLGLQQAAAEALGEHAGAVVAIDPRSGAVRALFSSPSFDPGLFAGRLSQRDWTALQENPLHPLQNRAIQGVYPPGSTIKPFLALAGLAEGLITPQTTVRCTGSVVLYGHRFRCWRRGGHGVVDLQTSLEESCDTYYYLLGQQLGIEGMAEWLSRFGFGTRTGIGLASEASGLIGTPAWSRRVRGTPWYPGESVSVSIGQGPVLATVIQLARAFAFLANGGHPITPYLVPQRESPRTESWIDEAQLALVTRGLEDVVHGARGTARSLGRLPVAGKTGTAQVIRLQEGVDSDELERRFRHHAWFVGWTPLDRPELVVAVIVEHGGGGGSVAAPAAGVIFRAFLANRFGAVDSTDPDSPATTDDVER